MSLIRCPNGHMFSERRYGSICPYCNIETKTKTPVQEQTPQQELEAQLFLEEVDPVCGWLVCIEGAKRGKDYKIKSGKNFIGRADDMDIQILGDNQISRRNHAVIVFDPKKKETVLLPGDANGIAYYNNDAVYVPTVLSAYDVIELGASLFLFIPFCGEHFVWQDKK